MHNLLNQRCFPLLVCLTIMTTAKEPSEALHSNTTRLNQQEQKQQLQQRRGKREGTTTTSSTGRNKAGKPPLTVQEQLNNAEATVAKALAQGRALQQSWRKHLWHLSLLLIILSFHQAQGPIGTCLENVKLYNNNVLLLQQQQQSDHNNNMISFGTAMKYLVQDSLGNFLSIGLAGMLSYFIIAVEPAGDFSHVSFKASTAVLPAILSLYFQQKQQASKSCCIDPIVTSSATDFVAVPVQRSFPVVLVFYLIVVACFSFMNAQLSYQEKNYESVRQMRRELEQARNKNKGTTAHKKTTNPEKK